MVIWRAVLVALAEPGRRPLPFTRAALFCPDCRALEPLKTTVTVLMLLGAEDDMTPSRLCEDVSRRSTPPGMVTTVVYPGARHAFDVPEFPAKMRYGLATIGHHAQAAAAAWEELQRFLGLCHRLLGGSWRGGVRVWQITSGERRATRRRPPPQRANIA